MTADLYVREGSRFVRVGDTLMARDVPPIPVPLRVADEHRPNHHVVPAPRCPHGHFERWARVNCRGCNAPARRR